MLADSGRPQVAVRRAHLLGVARGIFAERGYQATTMDDVARAAGFTKPILYQYFDSKAALYREIVADLADRLLARLSAAVATSENPRARLELALRAYFVTVVEETDAFRILFIHHHDGDTVRELRRLERGLVSFLEPFINAEVSDEHRRQLAGGIVGLAEGVATTWIVQREQLGRPAADPHEADQLAARAATLAWGGLRAVHD